MNYSLNYISSKIVDYNSQYIKHGLFVVSGATSIFADNLYMCNYIKCDELDVLIQLKDTTEYYCPLHYAEANSINLLIQDYKYSQEGVIAMEYKIANSKMPMTDLKEEVSAIKAWLMPPMPVLTLHGTSINEQTYINYLFALIKK